MTSMWYFEIEIVAKEGEFDPEKIEASLFDGDNGWGDMLRDCYDEKASSYIFYSGSTDLNWRFDPKEGHKDIVKRVHAVFPTAHVVTRWNPKNSFKYEYDSKD